MDQPTQIRESFDNLAAFYGDKDNPNYDRFPLIHTRLQAGLLLALAGRVSHQPYEGYWVNGGTSKDGYNHVYMVQVMADYLKPVWSCNCEDHRHNAPYVDRFGEPGYPGRICKHICAIAILAPLTEPVERPANLLELVHRLVQAQWMPAPPLGTRTVKGKPGHPILGKTRQVKKYRDLDLPGTPALLIWDEVDKKPVARLAMGRKKTDIASAPLVKWVTAFGQINKGVWQLVPEAESRYREWVAKVKGE